MSTKAWLAIMTAFAIGYTMGDLSRVLKATLEAFVYWMTGGIGYGVPV